MLKKSLAARSGTGRDLSCITHPQPFLRTFTISARDFFHTYTRISAGFARDLFHAHTLSASFCETRFIDTKNKLCSPYICARLIPHSHSLFCYTPTQNVEHYENKKKAPIEMPFLLYCNYNLTNSNTQCLLGNRSHSSAPFALVHFFRHLHE